MTDVGVRHATRVTLFRNGDPNFNGKNIVVNPRYYRNFESFLDTATFSTQCTSAVTRICTPLGRHNIESVEQLADGGTYVAVGRENFKRLKYGQPRPRKVPLRLPPVWRNHLPSSGRFRKVYDGERQALKRIYVYRNGDNITPARMILLKKRMLTDMELVLAALQESGLDFDFAISKLFTLNGRQIHDCDEIVNDEKYVAIERGSRFKPINYGGHVEISPRYASTKLPPLVPKNNNNNNVNRFPKKQVAKPPTIDKPRPPPVKQVKKVPPTQTQLTKKQKENKRSVVPNQQSIVSTSQDDNRDSFSNVSLSTTPPPLGESPDITLPTTNKAKESGTDDEKLPEIGEIPRDIDDLPKEEQESIGAHIYKASGMQREWGDMVKDSRNTPDKTLDNAPAEEVVEEIMEDIEDVTEVSETTEANVRPDEKDEKDGKKEKESKKAAEKTEKRVMEIAEEVVETLVDEDEEDKAENEKKKESNNEVAKQERSDSEASKDNEDKSDELSEEEEEKDEDSTNDDMASNDGDEAKVHDDDKVHESDAVDNDDKKDGSISKNLPDNLVGNDGDNKVDGDTGPAASDDKENDEEEDDDDDDDKDDSPAVSQNPSRRSSQEMNSEDEVKSEDEVNEEEDEKDDDDDDDEDEDDKSEEEESEDDKDEEDDDDDDDDDDKEDEDDASSVASEPEDDASNADPASEKEEETTEENATKENRKNQKVEKQRAQPKAKGKPDMIKGRSTKTRDVNKA